MRTFIILFAFLFLLSCGGSSSGYKSHKTYNSNYSSSSQTYTPTKLTEEEKAELIKRANATGTTCTVYDSQYWGKTCSGLSPPKGESFITDHWWGGKNCGPRYDWVRYWSEEECEYMCRWKMINETPCKDCEYSWWLYEKLPCS